MAIAKIFIVEDDQFLGNLIKRTLEKLDNMDVTHFLTPEDCLKNLHQNPDIVSIDYNLPGMNGVELLEKIRNYNDSIQCIMVSGQEKLDVVIDTYKKGVVDYIIKDDNALLNFLNHSQYFKNRTAITKNIGIFISVNNLFFKTFVFLT